MFLVAIFLAQAAPFDVQADFGVLAKQHCAREWPADFAMQAHCYGEQLAGADQFRLAEKEIGQPLWPALEKCTETWTKAGLPDWQMIGHCAVEQATAYRALREVP